MVTSPCLVSAASPRRCGKGDRGLEIAEQAYLDARSELEHVAPPPLRPWAATRSRPYLPAAERRRVIEELSALLALPG